MNLMLQSNFNQLVLDSNMQTNKPVTFEVDDLYFTVIYYAPLFCH